MSDNFRSAPPPKPTLSGPAQPKTAPPPTASAPAQTRTAPPPTAQARTQAVPPRAQAAPPHVSTATPENLAMVPRLAGESGAIEIDWEPMILGTNRSYGCVATAGTRE